MIFAKFEEMTLALRDEAVSPDKALDSALDKDMSAPFRFRI
jgi:hypothetical protein